MKITLPLLLVAALSTGALAQTAPVPAPAPVPTTPFFSDVPPTHWAFAAVQRLASAGIIEGYGTTPAPATRAVAKVSPAPTAKFAKKSPAKVAATKSVPKIAKAAR